MDPQATINKHTCFKQQFLIICLLFFTVKAHSAADQILNDNFFQNPAELSLIKKAQIIGGGVYLLPRFDFTGTSFGNTGSVGSKAEDILPYLLSSYRINDRYVFGVNVTPSAYAHVNWPIDSFVSNASTTTDIIFYRIGAQSSYQITDNFAIGLGLNLFYFKKFELNYVVPPIGNQFNEVSTLDFNADFGILYKFDSKNYITAAMYTPIIKNGHGRSALGSIVNNDFYLPLAAASVTYLGFQHFITDKWYLEEKIYRSGWTIQKNINFINSATGNFVIPTNWKNAWTFQVTTRYSMTNKLAVLGTITFETNPAPLATNAIGYPLAPTGGLSGGLDVSLRKDFSIQALYGYSAYIPKSLINNSNSAGIIHANFQTGVLQFIYNL